MRGLRARNAGGRTWPDGRAWPGRALSIGLAVVVAVLVGACEVLRVEPAVWLPDDGLPVPSAVESRDWLPFCGVMGEGGGIDADAGVATCLREANQAGRGAEAVLTFGDRQRPHINIIRSLPGGRVEILMRNINGIDGSVMWEAQTCAGIHGYGTALVRRDPCTDATLLGAGG